MQQGAGDQMEATSSDTFCGLSLNSNQIAEIAEIIATFPRLSRTELANTICELFSWKRPTGKLKSVECRQFLERLDEKGVIALPACREQYIKKAAAKIVRSQKAVEQEPITVALKQLSPLVLTRVESRQQRQLWYDYVDRYHYLGYQLPFGAQMRYFIDSGASGQTLGCFQFSSPAWKMAPRDGWIGWSDDQRKANLQKIINNSRFLLFPWVEVRNLASAALALAARVVTRDWHQCYGYRPVLIESLVDQSRFAGTCYRAANWIQLGPTTGRGRMDRFHQRQGAAVKQIYVYPLCARFRQELAGL
jgi:hypothetical protein